MSGPRPVYILTTNLPPSLDPATAFAVDLSGYVFNNGFCHQEWADVQVSFFSTSLKLHRRAFVGCRCAGVV